MPRLIFDIETVGTPFEELDEITHEHYLKNAHSDSDVEAIKSQMGFSPLTGQVVAIGILNPDTDKGGVLYIDTTKEPNVLEEDNMNYRSFATEKQMLKEFWDIASHYETFITFNGRAFDCPFLIVRSMANDIKPTVNLMPNRYYDSHIDLADRLSFFGAVRFKASLHLWCKALDIKSPKEDGISGKDVASLFHNGKYIDIAKYCGGDLGATSRLYEYWQKYVNLK